MEPQDHKAAVEFVVLATVVGLAVGAMSAPVTRHHLTRCRLPPWSLTTITTLAAGMLFALMTYTFGISGTVIAYSFLAAVSAPIAVVDVLEYRIPTRLTNAAYPGMISTFAAISVSDHDFSGLGRAAVSAGCLIGFYLFIASSARGALGAGDVRLAGPCGLALGWMSWTTVLQGTLMAFIFGAVVVLARRVRLRVERDAPVAFGPAMLAGTFTALILGV